MRRVLVSLALLACSIVVSLLVVEVLLRVMGIGFPPFYRQDAHLGGVLQPGVQGWYKAEGRSWVAVNSGGMRDREHAIPKPAGAYRIAVLGDSMTEALQVPQDKNFCSRLETDLRGCPRIGGKTPEVLNFGISGYGTAQELIMLRERVWQFQPDLVLLAMFPGNDIRNNNAELNADVFVPYYSLENGRLEVRYPPAPNTGPLHRVNDWLNVHSHLVQLISQIRKVRAHGSGLMVSQQKDPKQYGEAGVDDATFAPPATAAWRDAWSVTEALLLAMRDEVHSHGADFALMLIPSGIQDYPDAAVRQAYLTHPGVQDLSYAHHRLAAFAAANGIQVIPLEEPMRAYAQAHGVQLHGFTNGAPGFGHMNEEGHRLVAQEVAGFLCSRGRT